MDYGFSYFLRIIKMEKQRAREMEKQVKKR